MKKFETNLCEGLCGVTPIFLVSGFSTIVYLFIYYLFIIYSFLKITSGGQNALSIISLEFLV